MVDAQVINPFILEDDNFFLHLKLEIVFEIPALNDEKSNKQFISTRVKVFHYKVFKYIHHHGKCTPFL